MSANGSPTIDLGFEPLEKRSATSKPVAAAAIGAAVVAIAGIGGFATDVNSDWYQSLEKPSFQPPGAVFGPVWGVLYLMLGVATWLAWRDAQGAKRRLILGLFGANYVLNLAWTLIFFRGHSPFAAGVEIVALFGTIVSLVLLMKPRNKLAAWLLVPYGVWVGFATALTWTIAIQNS